MKNVLAVQLYTFTAISHNEIRNLFSEQVVSYVSFTQAMYSAREDEEVLTVSVERSGDIYSHFIVVVATHPSEGTANGKNSTLVSIVRHYIFLNLLYLIMRYMAMQLHAHSLSLHCKQTILGCFNPPMVVSVPKNNN